LQTASPFRRITLALLAVATLALGACGGGGFSRGIFQGYVMGKTEAEIVGQMGNPAEVDRKNPESPVIVFKEKTFDPDNGNRVDPVTFIYLRKNDQGAVVAYDIGFQG
jgi:hypothetical protein